MMRSKIMKFRGIERLRKGARRVVDMFRPKAIILLYHRVADLESDPQLLSVRPQHFTAHLQVIREMALPLRLDNAPDCIGESKNLPGIIVTFDDGYADNLREAKPLLERYEVPATVFVTSGYVGAEREFWQDELERIFLQPNALPDEFEIRVPGRRYHRRMSGATIYEKPSYETNRGWNIGCKVHPTLRHETYAYLVNELQSLPPLDAADLTAQLLDWAGLSRQPRTSHRPLSRDELKGLAAGGLVEIGSHTVTHPVLSGLPEACQIDEVVRSKMFLEGVIDRPVTSFAYPYGKRSDYNDQTITALRQAGYRRACANFPEPAQRESDPWQLPRYLVRDWDGEEFAAHMSEWLAR